MALAGCGGGSSDNNVPSPVSIEKKNGYYNITLDYTNASHKEVGRQLALSLQKNVPNYEKIIDNFIYTQIQALKQEFPDFNFNTALARANVMVSNGNFHQEYHDEILGMQEVFNFVGGQPGDGKLSKEELLVFELFGDVVRATSCSASAAIGERSATGKTIIGRNTDWLTSMFKDFAQLQAVINVKNGNKSFVNIGFAGGLYAASVFNKHNLFAAILDAQSYKQFPTNLSDKSSHPFDLRYAIENFSTLDEIVGYMASRDKNYVMNNLIFVADQSKAGVIENDMNDGPTPNRSLRVYNSALSPNLNNTDPAKPPLVNNQYWTFGGNNGTDFLSNVFAVVNDFRLPGNYYNHQDTYNTARWKSYRACYNNALGGTLDPQCSAVSGPSKIDTSQMTAIMGYIGPENDGYFPHGAIFGSEPKTKPDGSMGWTTLYSLVMKMDTMEMWIHFAPVSDTPPLRPTYQKITNPLY